MSNIYVKLRDAGTIFCDVSQGVSVTGNLPVEVKKTKKVGDFIKNGILIEVADSDAQKLIAVAAKDADAIAAANKAGETKVVTALKKENAALKAENAELSSAAIVSEERIAELEARSGGGSDAELQAKFDELQAKFDKQQVYVKGLQTQIANLKSGKPAADVPNPLEEGDGSGK